MSLPLQVFLEHRPRDEIVQLVSAKTNGATPLVLSCRNGHREVVEYLLERCNADVEQVRVGRGGGERPGGRQEGVHVDA